MVLLSKIKSLDKKFKINFFPNDIKVRSPIVTFILFPTFNNYNYNYRLHQIMSPYTIASNKQDLYLKQVQGLAVLVQDCGP